MSQYFYIVSQLNGFVLDISGNKKGGDVINYPPHGGANQLWKWDGSRLVSKLGLVLDIRGENTAAGTHCIGWKAHNHLNQKWRVEDGAIKSNLNNLVIDVRGSSRETGALVIMWRHHGALNQKWRFVPEDTWDDFKLEQAGPNPLTRAQFWKHLADRYLDVIVGYSIDDYEVKLDKTIETLDNCASQLEKVAKDADIAETVSESPPLVAGSAGVSIAGLLLAPFTGNQINRHWDDNETNDVQEATESVFRVTLSLRGFFSEYIENLKRAAEFLRTPDGEVLARDAYNKMELSKEAGTTAIRNVKQAKQIKELVDFIQADYYLLNGARIGLATDATIPGLTISRPILDKTQVASGTTSAKILFGSMAVVGKAFGMWTDTIGGAKKITKGRELAEEFRRSSRDLRAESAKLIRLYKELQ